MKILAAFALAFVLVSLISLKANATGTFDYNTLLSGVGCQPSANNCFVEVASNPQACVSSIIYVTGATTFHQQAYATALAAYMAGKTVRINYTQGTTGTCILNLLATPR
jgi:hypothetical protein